MRILRALISSRWKLLFAAGLVALSAVLYLLEWAVFQDGRSTFFYLLQDIAFLPISVLVLTVIVAEAVAWRDRESLLHKLNMVIGVFFSEVGNDLLRLLVAFDHAAPALCEPLDMDDGWDKARFATARSWLLARPCACDARPGDLQALADLLAARREFLLQLIENSSLLEHQSFTELMWAVLHVGEEFKARGGAGGVTEADLDHLSGDIGRAYRMLLREWLAYMQHLRADYPYLYALAVRTSPLRACDTGTDAVGPAAAGSARPDGSAPTAAGADGSLGAPPAVPASEAP